MPGAGAAVGGGGGCDCDCDCECGCGGLGVWFSLLGARSGCILATAFGGGGLGVVPPASICISLDFARMRRLLFHFRC